MLNIRRLRKYFRLWRISRVLNANLEPADLLRDMSSPGGGKKRLAQQAIYDLCETDPECVAIMRKHGATRSTLEDLYSMLVKNGAGQMKGMFDIPASALTDPRSLDYLLSHRSKRTAQELAIDAISGRLR